MNNLFLKGIAFKASKDESCYEIAIKNGVGKQVFSVENITEIGKIGLLFTNLEEELGYFIKKTGLELLSFSLREKLVTVYDADGNKSKEPKWYLNFNGIVQDVPSLKTSFPVAKEINNDLLDKLWAEISQIIVDLDGEVYERLEQIKKSV
jgi:hypothetical protein